MNPTAIPPPPTSAGDWPAWVITILCLIVVGQSGAIVWMFRDRLAVARVHADALAAVGSKHSDSLAKATDARVHDLQETIKAVTPSTTALHSLTEKVSLVAQRVDAHDDQHDRHDERATKIEERIERWEERTPMPRKSAR